MMHYFPSVVTLSYICLHAFNKPMARDSFSAMSVTHFWSYALSKPYIRVARDKQSKPEWKWSLQLFLWNLVCALVYLPTKIYYMYCIIIYILSPVLFSPWILWNSHKSNSLSRVSVHSRLVQFMMDDTLVCLMNLNYCDYLNLSVI